MRWRQFLTPVESLDAKQAQKFIMDMSRDELTILDVRQPNEYENGHISGAKLIPMANLTEQLHSIDPHKHTVVYCAIGGRSRIASQMLAGRGFNKVYNLSGGFKAWKGQTAIGQEDLGVALFIGDPSPEKTLAVAYSLEAGLRDFYLSMIPKVKNEAAKALFHKLSDIEVKHQDRIFKEYIKISGKSLSRKEFEKNTLIKAVEGGMTTDEYVNLFRPDWESLTDIVELAMSIEAQALDLYLRAADRNSDTESRKVLIRIAEEEQTHLAQLGNLIETMGVSG